MAARALAILGHVASEPRYIEAAQRTVDLFASDVARAPIGYATLLEAAALLESPPVLVVLTGDRETCAGWHRHLAATYRPGTWTFDMSGVRDVPAPLVKSAAPASGAAAYVCRGATCLPPLSALDDVVAAIA